MRQSRRGEERGTTLVELLVAATFVGVCASVILSTATTSAYRAGYTKRRAIVLATAEDQMDLMRANTRSGAPTVGTTSANSTLTGVPGTVSVVTTTTTVNGYAYLYDVKVVATWTDDHGSDSITLESYVRPPHA